MEEEDKRRYHREREQWEVDSHQMLLLMQGKKQEVVFPEEGDGADKDEMEVDEDEEEEEELEKGDA